MAFMDDIAEAVKPLPPLPFELPNGVTIYVQEISAWDRVNMIAESIAEQAKDKVGADKYADARLIVRACTQDEAGQKVAFASDEATLLKIMGWPYALFQRLLGVIQKRNFVDGRVLLNGDRETKKNLPGAAAPSTSSADSPSPEGPSTSPPSQEI